MSILDTSGFVHMPGGPERKIINYLWSDLTDFERDYLTAALTPKPEVGVFIDAFRFADLAPESLRAALQDCASLQNPERFAFALDAGAFCWEMRQLGWPSMTGGPVLREEFPPLTVTLGDDGKVRFQ